MPADTPTTMKAITLAEYGGPEMLTYTDIPTPTPSAGQLLVRIEATSINAADYRMMRGNPFLVRFFAGLRRPTKVPVLGGDAAGVVAAVGDGVTDVAVGDRVFAEVDKKGTFAEYAVIAADAVAPIPEGVSSIDAAAVPLAGRTALQAVRDKSEFEPGQSVLIQGAGGGVGTMTVQIAKARGAEVTAVCGPTSAAVAEEAGADRIIDYNVTDITEIDDRYDVIIAINGHHKLATYKQLLKPGGRYVMVGGDNRQIFEGLLMGKLAFARSDKTATVLTMDETIVGADMRELADMMAAGTLRPFIDRTYPLAETADAMRYVEAGHVPGKVVVTVTETPAQG